MSLCDSDMKNHVECSTEYAEVEGDVDSLRLLAIIRKLVYIRGTHDLHVHHNKAMSHMNLINLYQEHFQDMQDFRNQYMAMRNMCDELGLRFGRCTENA